MGTKARRMRKLRIGETSGVDRPAHLTPGWMVRKEADVPDNELVEEIDLGELIDERISAAVETLEKEMEVDMPEDETTTPDPRDERIAALEAELAVAKGQNPEEAELAKAMEQLPEAVRKAWQADRERIAKAEAKANAAEEARLSREYLAKAEGLPGVPADTETLATVLRKVHENLDPTAAAEVDRIFASINAVAKDSKLFKEMGGLGQASGAESELESVAAEFLKTDGTLNPITAMAKARETRPDLVEKFYKEQGITRGGE